MASPTLSALKTNPKFIFFSDFDGTITERDSNDYLIDNIGFGQKLRKQGNQDVLNGRTTFRESLRVMMDSIKTPYDECINLLLANTKLDPYFIEFYEYCSEQNIPIVILSGGMEPIIRAILQKFLGDYPKNIEIVSNNVASRDGKCINEEGGWRVVFHDESHFGHDKSLEIRPYASLPSDQRPTLFYAGDGVSDLSAAKETDLLFAKQGHDLITYCLKEKVPFIPFEDWSTILSTVKSIVSGKTSVAEISTASAAASKQTTMN
ncbi:Pdp3-interacting factor 1 [Golovinomyces cichoracearum]|uniref:Pdp3-interacting factor 1 n=1 Tax=Golovinomyces cichoracearum TaxID=62708 RepID=A0A420H9K1_9PEZI|nr:Pdp3-interacting factor 1 [Golovinomyces cichoracearum]